jgi:hypothetical protein
VFLAQFGDMPVDMTQIQGTDRVGITQAVFIKLPVAWHIHGFRPAHKQVHAREELASIFPCHSPTVEEN